MIERIILTEEAAPTGPSMDSGRHVEGGEHRRSGFGVGAANQKRGAMQARMDRRHHRDVDIAPADGFDSFRGAALVCGAHESQSKKNAPFLRPGRAASAASCA